MNSKPWTYAARALLALGAISPAVARQTTFNPSLIMGGSYNDNLGYAGENQPADTPSALPNSSRATCTTSSPAEIAGSSSSSLSRRYAPI